MMSRSFLFLILASTALADGVGTTPILHGRSVLGPIATDSADSITGGAVECASPPVDSFFTGLNPPVSKLYVNFLISKRL